MTRIRLAAQHLTLACACLSPCSNLVAADSADAVGPSDTSRNASRNASRDTQGTTRAEAALARGASGSGATARTDLEIIEVLEPRPRAGATITLDAADMPASGADLTRGLARRNGIDANENGPLSGQLQVRGLYGTRIGVRLEGMHTISGGPNWMDPPLFVAPAGLVESITVHRAPVGVATGSGPGAQAELRWKRPDFGEAGSGWRPWLDTEASAHSVDSGHALSAAAGLASPDHRIHLAASREAGDDYETPAGTIRPSAYERRAFAVGYGRRYDHGLGGGDSEGRFDLSWRRIEAGESGTPSLPMDIDFFDTDILQLAWAHRIGAAEFSFDAGYSRVEHGMNNSLQRPIIGNANTRAVLADAEGLEAALAMSMPLAVAGLDGELRAGAGWREERHDATVLDPTAPAFFLLNFADARLDTTTAWAEWTGAVRAGTLLTIGARALRFGGDSDAVDAFPATLVDADPEAFPIGTGPRGVQILRDRANSADSSRADHGIDWAVSLQHSLTPALTVEANLARRMRAAGYQERFLWVPLESTAGLADGNTYVGDPDLRPEIAHVLELGALWQTPTLDASLRGYWRRIDDAILGVAATDPVVIAVSTGASGDPTPLRFANVDARIRGIEAELRLQLRPGLELDAGLSWQEGERRSDGDPLWRIAPPNARIALHWSGRWGRYSLTQELVARGDELSRVQLDDPTSVRNRFEETPGYGLTHAQASWKLPGNTRLDLGIDNLFDREYVSPLAGFNRAGDSIVAIGDQLPGRGRNLFARVSWQLQ